MTVTAEECRPSDASCRSEMMTSVSATALGYQAAACRGSMDGASSGTPSRRLRCWTSDARETAGQPDHREKQVTAAVKPEYVGPRPQRRMRRRCSRCARAMSGQSRTENCC